METDASESDLMSTSSSEGETEYSMDISVSTSDCSDSSSDTDSSESICGGTNYDVPSLGMRAELAKIFVADRSRTAHVGKVLKLIRKNGNTDIPLCYSTLVGTPNHKIAQRDVGEGKYFHYGIENNLLKMETHLRNKIFKSSDEIVIDIGIDGGSPFPNSSSLSLWPIMGAIVNMPHISPFLIGCYAGPGDIHAKDADVFLMDFCDELEKLFSEGVSMKCGLKTLVVRLFTMDAPARAKICNGMGHNSHDGCPMCAWSKTVFAGKVVFPNKIGEFIRSDETFSSRWYRDHHQPDLLNRLSRLEMLAFKMLSQFPIIASISELTSDYWKS